MKRVLVTGGAGFIGSHLVEKLLSQGVAVTVLDNFETGYREYLPSAVRLIEADVVDPDAVEQSVVGSEIIFHLAAFASVPESYERPERCFAVNTLGLLHLLRSAVRHRVRKFVFSSSSAVYSDEGERRKLEQEMPQPASPYAVTKLGGEQLLEIHAHMSGLSYVALRYFNVFGPRQSPDSDYAAVIPAFIRRALDGEDLIIYGDGSQTRDFVYVDDVVRANLEALHSDKGIYNIGLGTSLSILELAQRVLELSGARSGITFAPPRPGDVHYSGADVSRARCELGWTARCSIERGLSETISWFRTQNGYTNDRQFRD